MTTPTPDKLEIPEAAVEAAMEKLRWQLPADDGTGEIWRIVRSALAAAIPHMPDRGYAEGVEAAARTLDSRARNAISSDMERIIYNDATAIRALAPPAPADNGDTSQRDDLDLAKIEASIDRGARRTDHRFRLHDPVATPSPIEDVAGPSEAEIEAAAKIIDSNAFEGELQSSYWHSRRDNARDRARRVLAARRVRHSPADEDARDGVLPVAGTVLPGELNLVARDAARRAIKEAMPSLHKNNLHIADDAVAAYLTAVIQSQRKG